jgi:hypothetical protein
MNTLQKIIEEAETHEAAIEHLKKISPIYPRTIEVNMVHLKQVYASTLVRVEHDGNVYLTHVVECMGYDEKKDLDFNYKLHDVLKQLHIEAYKVKYLYIPVKEKHIMERVNPLDADQRSEQDRIKDLTEEGKL